MLQVEDASTFWREPKSAVTLNSVVARIRGFVTLTVRRWRLLFMLTPNPRVQHRAHVNRYFPDRACLTLLRGSMGIFEVRHRQHPVTSWGFTQALNSATTLGWCGPGLPASQTQAPMPGNPRFTSSLQLL